MTSIVRDTQWPFVGDSVTLTATGMTGNRALFGIVSKPPASALELYRTGSTDFLAGTEKTVTIKPDADGTYVIGALDCTVTTNPPHYDGHGSTGASIGVETIATNAVQLYTLRVGRKLETPIGYSPHVATLSLLAHGDSALTTTAGVLTYVAGEGYAPKLVSAATDRAALAARSTAVVNALAEIGGTGYAGTNLLVGWQSVIGSSVVTDIGWSVRRFNSHIQATKISVHKVADAAGSTAVSTAAFATLASCESRMGDLQTAYELHRQIAPTVHDDADAVNTMSAYGGASTTAAVATYTLTNAGVFNAHIRTVYPDIDNTGNLVHYAPGGGIDAVSVTAVVSLSSLCTRARTLCQKYMEHRARNDATYFMGDGYHQAASSWTYSAARPYTYADAANAINELLAMLHSHATNVNYDTGSATTYHDSPDWRARTDIIPRANADDVASIVQAKAVFDKILSDHAGRLSTSDVHTGGSTVAANLYFWQPTQYGIDRIHAAFYSTINTAATTTPANENMAAAKLVMLAGFKKV